MFKIFKIFLPFARKVVVKIDLVRINVVEPFKKNSSCRNWSVSKFKFLSNL